MFSVQQYHGVDPWVAAWGSASYQHQVSQAAAARYAVVQAVRERRNASRSDRHTPAPDRVEFDEQPRSVDSATPVRVDDFTPVG